MLSSIFFTLYPLYYLPNCAIVLLWFCVGVHTHSRSDAGRKPVIDGSGTRSRMKRAFGRCSAGAGTAGRTSAGLCFAESSIIKKVQNKTVQEREERT